MTLAEQTLRRAAARRIEILDAYRATIAAAGEAEPMPPRRARRRWTDRDGQVVLKRMVPEGVSNGRRPVPPRLVQFWDRSPPEQILALFDRNRELAETSEIEHVVFDAPGAVAFMRDVGETELAEHFCAAAHPAMKADIFRIVYLLRAGGIYLDADVVLRCPIKIKGVRAPVLFQRTKRESRNVLNWFMIAPKETPVFRVLRRRLLGGLSGAKRADDGTIPPDEILSLTGPGLVTVATAAYLGHKANPRCDVALLDQYALRALTQNGPSFLKDPLQYKKTELHWAEARRAAKTP